MARRSPKTKLLELLLEHSYRRSRTKSFRLASGKRSNFYIDCKATTMRAKAMPLVGELGFALVPRGAEAVGGLTMGADPIAGAIACFSAAQRRPVDAFSVRKEPKAHGMCQWIEGCGARGSKVVVVDDVVTTGGSTILAIQRCREEGLRVVGVIALVDREEEDGINAIRREAGPGVPVTAIFTRSEIDQEWARRQALG